MNKKWYLITLIYYALLPIIILVIFWYNVVCNWNIDSLFIINLVLIFFLFISVIIFMIIPYFLSNKKIKKSETIKYFFKNNHSYITKFFLLILLMNILFCVIYIFYFYKNKHSIIFFIFFFGGNATNSLCSAILAIIFSNFSTLRKLYDVNDITNYNDINIHLGNIDRHQIIYFFMEVEKQVIIRGVYINPISKNQIISLIFSLLTNVPLLFSFSDNKYIVRMLSFFFFLIFIFLNFKVNFPKNLWKLEKFDSNLKNTKWIIKNLKDIKMSNESKNKKIFIHDFYSCTLSSSLLTIVLLFLNEKEIIKLTVICSDEEHENWSYESKFEFHNLKNNRKLFFNKEIINSVLNQVNKNKKIKDKQKVINKIEKLNEWLEIQVKCPSKYF